MVRGIERKTGTAKPPKRLRSFRVGEGLPNLTQLSKEIYDMVDVLMGRADPPIGGALSMMETADAYFARASEIDMLLAKAEREGRSMKAYSTFRTKELRNFKELAKGAANLGSRRLTAANLRHEQEIRGRESL